MTLKEIASLAGVSTATVSYVINGTGSVSDEVRNKILKIIKETGYRSNRVAKTLRTSTSNLIGVVVEDITAWSSSSTIQGIGQYAEENGKTMLISDLSLYSKAGRDLEHLSDHKEIINAAFDALLGSQVEGIIYVSLRDRDVSSMIPAIDKPLILVDCFAGNIPEVTYDNYNISFEIGKRLIKNGHKSIAVLCGSPDYKSCYQRLSGFQSAMREYGFSQAGVKLLMCDWEYENALQQTEALFTEPDHPSAVFAMNDQMGVAALRSLYRLNFNVPEDVEVIGFDNNIISRYARPTLSTIEIPLHEIGYKAAELLYSMKNGIDIDRRIFFPSRLIERESTRK